MQVEGVPIPPLGHITFLHNLCPLICDDIKLPHVAYLFIIIVMPIVNVYGCSINLHHLCANPWARNFLFILFCLIKFVVSRMKQLPFLFGKVVLPHVIALVSVHIPTENI